MLSNYIVFDLDIKMPKFQDKNPFKLENEYEAGFFYCCTYTKEHGTKGWFEQDVEEMMRYITEHKLVISFNHYNLFYKVIAGVLKGKEKEKNYQHILETSKGKNFDLYENLLAKTKKHYLLQQLAQYNGCGLTFMDIKDVSQKIIDRKFWEVIRCVHNDVIVIHALFKSLFETGKIGIENDKKLELNYHDWIIV